MAKKYVLTVITHERKTYDFKYLEKLYEFVEGYFNMKSSYFNRLISDGYVHVPSMYRADSLDVYNIFAYEDYSEEYINHLDASKDKIKNTTGKLTKVSQLIDDKDELIQVMQEDFQQKIMLNDMKNKSVLLNLAIAITKLENGSELFKEIERKFYKEANKEVIETYERLFK